MDGQPGRVTELVFSSVPLCRKWFHWAQLHGWNAPFSEVTRREGLHRTVDGEHLRLPGHTFKTLQSCDPEGALGPRANALANASANVPSVVVWTRPPVLLGCDRVIL